MENIHPMLVQWWASVADAGPALNQRWAIFIYAIVKAGAWYKYIARVCHNITKPNWDRYRCENVCFSIDPMRMCHGYNDLTTSKFTKKIHAR